MQRDSGMQSAEARGLTSSEGRRTPRGLDGPQHAESLCRLIETGPQAERAAQTQELADSSPATRGAAELRNLANRRGIEALLPSRLGDAYEGEADRVAADILAQMHGTERIARTLAASPELAREGPPPSLGPILQTPQRSAATGGESLPSQLQGGIASATGIDPSAIRVHRDPRADGLNALQGSRAFTQGRDIYFRQGEYRPETLSGQALILHEALHTVQQGAVAQGAGPRGPRIDLHRSPFAGPQRSGHRLPAKHVDAINEVWVKGDWSTMHMYLRGLLSSQDQSFYESLVTRVDQKVVKAKTFD
jgi:hypothetical protein